MFSVFIISLIFCAICEANHIAPILCSTLPPELYECIGSPQVVKPENARHCASAETECERMTCIFRKAGWFKGDKLDKDKLAELLEEYSREHPAWRPATLAAAAACVTPDLPAQGVFLNCPAYDVAHCIFASFLKNTQLSQWAPSAECAGARQFAAVCPVCPSDCFAQQIPIGSCNSCLALPRSP